MPAKYMIHTQTAPNRFKPSTKSGIIAWTEGCLGCRACVKKQCVYRVYINRGLDTKQMIDSIDNQCMNCLRCVQGCPMELIHKSINPEYAAPNCGIRPKLARSLFLVQAIQVLLVGPALTPCGPTCLRL
jgi:ferredoxin